MKKLLMGAMATAMAATAFGGQIEDDLLAREQLVKMPINATVQVGTMTPTTSIAVTGDLDFGTISAMAGSNPESSATKKVLNVYKVTKMNGQETGREELGQGQYAYKLGRGDKTWDDVKGFAMTTGTDYHDKIFLKDGQYTAIGSGGLASDAYGGRVQAKADGLNVWLAGNIDSANNGNSYEVSANVFVTFPENAGN